MIKVLTVMAATMAVSVAALFMDAGGLTTGLATGNAEARIGRPLTPMSYAGVARRTTRRAVAVGAAAGAAVYAPGIYYSPVPGCGRYVDAYGRVYYRCP
jgi:hypothetical protein